MTEPPILRQAVYHDQPFRDWVKTNSAKLLKTRPEIKEHGLWVVRWTYATRRSSLNAWTSKDKDVTIGFNAKFVGAGEVGPSGGWYESENDSGWMHAQAKVRVSGREQAAWLTDFSRAPRRRWFSLEDSSSIMARLRSDR